MSEETVFSKCQCQHCDGGIEFSSEHAGQLIVCPHCGQDTTLFVPPATVRETDPAILSESGITITGTRIIFPDRTFALANVSSVRCVQITPSYFGPVMAVLVGAFICLGSLVPGCVVIAGALIWLITRKTTFGVAITAAGGEVTGFETPDQQLADRILIAINKAIISRG